MVNNELPSIKELNALDHDAQHVLLCQWARDAKAHEIEQNGSLGRIEKQMKMLQFLVILNVFTLAMQFPETMKAWAIMLKGIFGF